MVSITGVKDPFKVEGLRISPTGGALGAEIWGVDLREPIRKELAAYLRTLLHRYQVLIFRDQNISPGDQLLFTMCFGKIDPGPTEAFEGVHVSGYPDILCLSNETGSPTSTFGSAWHSDGLAYFKAPQGVTMLHCLACPATGGSTLFANQYSAFEAASKGLQEVLKKLRWRATDHPTFVRPVIRRHPQTGRFHFYCDPDAKFLLGMRADESKHFFDLITGFQTDNKFVFEHRWRVHDVVLWENCTTLHKRASPVDFRSQGLRAMHRTTTLGHVYAKEYDLDEHCETSPSQPPAG
jgi:taurine dioxygenase